MTMAEHESTLSVLSHQGLPLATTSLERVQANFGGVGRSQTPKNRHSTTTTTTTTTHDPHQLQSASPPSSPTDASPHHQQHHHHQALDFVGSGNAVKSLFSIPVTEQPVFVAVHNLDGTLLIDDAVILEEGQAQKPTPTTNASSSSSSRSQETHRLPHESTAEEASSQTKRTILVPSSPSLALALSPHSSISPTADPPTNEALALLSNRIQCHQQQVESENPGTKSADASTNDGLSPDNTQQQQQISAIPPPVRDYLEWKFQDMNLLVGSDSLIVRPESGDPTVVASGGVLLRMEEAKRLRQLVLAGQQQTRHSSPPASSSSVPAVEASKSYAQILAQPSSSSNMSSQKHQRRHDGGGGGGGGGSEKESNQESPSKEPLNLDQVQLQTCIIPSSGPLGGFIQGSRTTMEPTKPSSSTSTSQCVVLDAYLDTLMANVPQLALCLQEKGLIQSVKLLPKQVIPSMMMHPSTLDTSNPVDTVMAHGDANPLFSPQVIETNASALLRFLKANCTQNNTTYLLRTDGGNSNSHSNIQLFDISSISQQRQKKWIWWLATMSYRFALRLRQLECHGVVSAPQQQRAFRDRQRSLLQTTLDLLQDVYDMDGNAHESLVASVREHLADTYLGGRDELTESCLSRTNSDESVQLSSSSPETVLATTARSTTPPPSSIPATARRTASQTAKPPPPISKSHELPSPAASHQPYATVTVDALNKANDHLVHAIKALHPVLEKALETPKGHKRGRGRVQNSTPDTAPAPAMMVLQLLELHYKTVNVSLRLAEHHLKQYYSSSAMQALRQASRNMSQAASLLDYLNIRSDGTNNDQEEDPQSWTKRLQLQYTWLWEHCGHFARSFAADELWRDRGHMSGDDVLQILKEVDTTLRSSCEWDYLANLVDPLEEVTKGQVALQQPTLTALVVLERSTSATESLTAAADTLAQQGQLQRDERQALVAACISYNRAIGVFQDMRNHQGGSLSSSDGVDPATTAPTILNLLRQRLGDACNETGKVLLAALRTLLASSSSGQNDNLAAEALLDSAQFWFYQGLEAFEACEDTRNVALLRCNLCQCHKLRANATFSSNFTKSSSDNSPTTTTTTSPSTHAELCLQTAAEHLQAAHEALGQRHVDPWTWDMVSNELATTFLVLAVRRRQSLLGGGNVPVIFQALRLSPGKERSIVEPMEKALEIYEQSGNDHQAAAVHYQLALTHSKVWTCQRDETKTREKLSAAFLHYNMAFAYFSNNLRGGNEPTFVLLCLDIASLYAAVAGEECLTKALERCLDTCEAFSQDSLTATISSTKPNSAAKQEWLNKMDTLAESVEDRVFKLLKSLVKLHPVIYKDLYRAGLTAKMVKNVPNEELSAEEANILSLHDILVAIRKEFQVVVSTA